jgi:hypothetical protein
VEPIGNSNSRATSDQPSVTLSSNAVVLGNEKIDGAGTLAITGAVGNLGSLNVSGNTGTLGVKTLTIDANSSMSILMGNLILDGVNLTNNGAITWFSGGNITSGTASTVTNNGTFTVTGGDHTYEAGADLTNSGTFTISLASATKDLSFDSRLTDNLGAVVNVVVGNLYLTSTDTVSAPVAVNGNAALYITGGYVANVGAGITGQGTVDVDTVFGSITAAAGLNFSVSPLMKLTNFGDLTGPGLFQLNGGLYSQGGSVTTTSVQTTLVNLNVGGGLRALAVSGGSTVQFNGGSWNSGNIDMSGGSELDNLGSFLIRSGAQVTMDPNDISRFMNTPTGTVTFAGLGTVSFNTYFSTAGTITDAGQTVDFLKGLSQTGGLVNLVSGTFDFLNNPFGYTLSVGVFQASGTIANGNLVVQGGTLELTGDLAITGNLTLGAGGIVQVDADAVSYGRVDVTGTATLGGGLTVKLAQGYVPAKGTKRTILTATAGANGAFAAPPAGWQINKPNANTVELQKL